MSDTSFNTIIMDNSHNPKNDDGQASDVHPDVDSPVHILYVLWCTRDILYIPIEHIIISFLAFMGYIYGIIYPEKFQLMYHTLVLKT